MKNITANAGINFDTSRVDSGYKRDSYWRDVLSRFARHHLAMAAAVILVLEIALVIFLPGILKLDPYANNAGSYDSKPSALYPLGTDEIGRDVFARLVYGGRVSLMVGICSALISACIGIPLGMIAGFYGGAVRMVIMRVTDTFMSFPHLVIQLFIVGMLGSSQTTVMFVIGALGWTGFARLSYSRVLLVREQEYIEAARAIGTSAPVQLFKYFLPNSLSPLLVNFSFATASAIIQESSLSFLGLGIQPPTASWGNMIRAAQAISILSYRPWRWIPPGILLVLTVLSINFIGDGLRDALDPKMKI
jgi:peptide/nickel transport system permease protein